MSDRRLDLKYGLQFVDRTGKAVASVKKRVRGISKSLTSLAAVGGAALGVAGIGGGVVALAASARATARDLDTLAKTASGLGTTTEELDALNYVAELNGASADQLRIAWKAAAKQLDDASRGAGEGKQALDKLGISATDASGRIKTVPELIREVSDKLPRLRSETERVAAVQRIFGESGTALLPMLRQGSAAIREQTVEAYRYGVRTEEMARMGEDAADAQLKFSRSMRALGDVLAIQVLPLMTRFSESIAGKVIASLLGIDTEYQKVLMTMSAQPDAEFFADALVESDALGRKISELRKEQEGANEEWARTAQELRKHFPPDIVENALKAAKENHPAGVIARELELLISRDAQLTKAVERRQAAIAAANADARDAIEDLGALMTEEEKEVGRYLDAFDPESAVRAIGRIKVALLDLRDTKLDVKNVPLLEEDLRTLDTLHEIEESFVRSGDAFAGSLGAEMGRFVTEGRTGAAVFENAWKGAIASLAADLTRLAILRTLGALIPGGGLAAIIPALAGGVAGGGGGQTAAMKAAPGSLGGDIYFQPRSLLPMGVSDYVRAKARLQDVAREANEFAFSRS